MTVACWIKVSEFTLFGQVAVAKSDSSWRLQRWWTTPFMEFACNGVSTETNETGGVIGDINVADGQWHHVAGVYDGSRICLYIDGILDNFEFASGKIGLDDYPVCIGSSFYSSGPGGRRYWHGEIDDVRIYNYALSKTETRALYEGRGSRLTGE
ncbi:MAG: LamG domain-containing protein [Planctomycetota bacterium]